MTLDILQKTVDDWINNTDIGYFDKLTNTVILMEEVGELASIIARTSGSQIAKKNDSLDLENEIGDVLWVLTCIANQHEISLTNAIKKNLSKKNNRDKNRFDMK